MSLRKPYVTPLPDGRVLALGDRPLVMGILNVTPDSFAEAVHTADPAGAIRRGIEMEAEGADILDVGGESTRPGAAPVTADEELARVVQVVRGLARCVRTPISVDTYRAEVAKAAISEGASIINDISGLLYEPELAAVVAGSGAALVLMHMRGRPKDMYEKAEYHDLIGEVALELKERMEKAVAAGIPTERLIVDPGVGFAKAARHSYGVLARLPELSSALDRPVLVGPSRKSFMRDALAGRPAPDRDWGTAAAVAAAVLAGAHIVRVHAISEMTQVVRVAEEIRRAAQTR